MYLRAADMQHEQLIYSFCTSSSLQIPFFVRISSIEGNTDSPLLSQLLTNPSQRNIASNSKYWIIIGKYWPLVLRQKSMLQCRYGRIVNRWQSPYEQATSPSNPLEECTRSPWSCLWQLERMVIITNQVQRFTYLKSNRYNNMGLSRPKETGPPWWNDIQHLQSLW